MLGAAAVVVPCVAHEKAHQAMDHDLRMFFGLQHKVYALDWTMVSNSWACALLVSSGWKTSQATHACSCCEHGVAGLLLLGQTKGHVHLDAAVTMLGVTLGWRGWAGLPRVADGQRRPISLVFSSVYACARGYVCTLGMLV